MGKNGGARPGAGRPKKTVKFERPINRAEKQVCDHLPVLVDTMLAQAKGVLLIDDDEQIRALCDTIKRHLGDNDDARALCERIGEIYTVRPDTKAGQYLIDRIMGKPTERKEIDGNVNVTTHEAALEELE